MSEIRVAFILPGLGRVQRGAEMAFREVASQLAGLPDMHVEVFGTGGRGLGQMKHHTVGCLPREKFERWPSLPCLRNEYQYEELSFILSLAGSGVFHPENFDITVTCTYPYANWFVRRRRTSQGPLNLFVTQNGDWPCREKRREYRYFHCDGLICTNPEYFERHRDQFRCALIPNGVDPAVFRPSESRQTPERCDNSGPVILMVSALIESKAVIDGVRAAARIKDARLIIAGDGPQREEVARVAHELLPGRFRMLGNVDQQRMPDLYREADVFLHMSRDEPFGIVYLEAASSGLPLVVHDSPTTRWILGDDAVFVDTRDPDAVARGLRNSMLSGTRSRMESAARRRVTTAWSWKIQALKYRNFMRETLTVSHQHGEN